MPRRKKDLSIKSEPRSMGEELLMIQMRERGIPTPLRDYKFFDQRKWTADFAWPDRMILLEVEGFAPPVYRNGEKIQPMSRHQSYEGYENDCRKYNQAQFDDWTLYRYTTKMVEDGEAIDDLCTIFGIPKL